MWNLEGGVKEPIDRMLDAVEWTECPPTKDDGSGLPYATHYGVLDVMGIKLKVAQLNTGQRVIEEESLRELFGPELFPVFEPPATPEGGAR